MRPNRRQFVAGLGAAGLALPELARANAPAQAETAPGRGFPRDNYTPYGYLDNPYHAWELHPSGVIRSVEAMGFGFYYPAGPGGYFDYTHNAIYQALLRLAVLLEGRSYFDAADFAPGQLRATHHSHNLFTFDFDAGAVSASATFLQVAEDTLAVRASLHNRGADPVRAGLVAHHDYHLGAQGWWGRDGLSGVYDPPRDAINTRSFAAGTVFTLTASRPSTQHATQGVSYYPDPLTASLGCDFTIAAGAQESVWFYLTRGVNLPAVKEEHARVRGAAAGELDSKRREDDNFWSAAPRLTGDWPAHWKRGFVYDFETLRMIVRRPIGVYNNPWDAMQIQVPRNVLAETSMDMWALSYADPATARAVLAGQFLDAIDANVPCMRENGVMNMVAADGSACGTSIAWCYPFFCLDSVMTRVGDRDWMAQVYPKLAQFVRWTLAHRTDRDGFVVGKCSWETGMDASSRFQINQPTGAELIDFIRVVELQAATTHAAGVLARYATTLGQTAEAAIWLQLVSDFTTRTLGLWNGRDWFQDFDTRNQQPITPRPGQREIGQSAPIFCGVATSAQIAAMIPRLREYPLHPEYYLEWPSLVLPYLESLWTAGEYALAAQVTCSIAERIYLGMDRRTPGHGLGWPGVSCEMWGLQGAHGGEGYGWGAAMPAHVIRNLIGFRDDELRPNLPDEWLQPGRTYGVDNLQRRGDRLQLSYTVMAGGRLRVQGRWAKSGRRVDQLVSNRGLVAWNAEPF
ncbi:MAG TPA: hypothetical protein VIC32_09945 [Terriglobales bacterium]|jgi:hypothetical protein